MLRWLQPIIDAVLGRASGKPDRPDTATRMAMDADFSRGDDAPSPKHERAPDVDPLAELRRLIKDE